MKRNTLALFALVALGIVVTAQGDASPQSLPAPGTRIDASNASRYGNLIPAALRFAIDHGLTLDVIADGPITWPALYQRETEQFSSQVTLSAEGALQNYSAGLPFPRIDETDPQAGAKIAYNWRYGPFLPRQLMLDGEQKSVAYSIDPARPPFLARDDSHRDYRNENNCERVVLMRSDSRAQSQRASAEWKERGDECGPDRAASITIRYSDPARGDDDYGFIPALRKWREISLQGGYPNQSCTYACTQLFWEYLPPKTEVYSITLAAKQPIVACIREGDAPASGIIDGDEHSRFASLDCRVREAYVLEMLPRHSTPEGVLRARAYIDSETFVYLAGEFFRDAQPDAGVAVWRLERTTVGHDALVLANDFYVPADRPNFLLALDLDSAKLAIDGSGVSIQMFNPRAQIFSDGRM